MTLEVGWKNLCSPLHLRKVLVPSIFVWVVLSTSAVQ